MSDLRNRLIIPTKDAVPRPHILSPQLLDYISFLSLLEVDISCILVFKDVYLEELQSYFDYELKDSDILSIIKLRPSNPGSLSSIVHAYDKPKVKFKNLTYWKKTGFISESEQETVLKMIL